MVALNSLPDRAAIQRATAAADGYGNETKTWATIAWVNCRLRPESGSAERTQGERTTATGRLICTLPHDAAVLSTDRLEILGQQYEIEEPITEQSNQICRHFYVKKVL